MRVQRLILINPTTIDEYQQLSELRSNLDGLNADLVGALDTLKNVIREVEKEIQNYLEYTFYRIYSRFQESFLKFFSDSSAYLELTYVGCLYVRQIVWFIYITMEMADQLMDIALYEHGCSHFLAVSTEEVLVMIDARAIST